ncbi:MAG: AAA family ATPase [Thermoleophilaceae bacterium]
MNLLERDAYALCPSCGINALAYENRDGTWTVECPDDGPRVFRADVSSSDGDRYPLLSYDDLLQLPDPTWLVEGFMPEGLSVLWGPPSSYKTFVALDLALSIASGRAWHGRAVDARDVMYIAAEGRPGIRMRAEAWSAAHGHPSLSRFRVLPQAVNLLDRQQFERARRTMQLVSEPALTVIDPMARSMVGGDENKSQDVGRFIEAACSLADSVLVTHHAGKDGVRERGSGALEGAADMMARATGDGLWVDLTCTKPPKDAEAWSAMRLKMQAVGESLVPRLGDLAETSELRRRVYEEVCAAAPISQKAVRERIEKRGAVVTSALHALEAEGRIEQTINGYRPCPDVPDTPGHAASPATGGGVSQEGVPPVGGTPGDTPHPAPGVQTTDR